MARRQDPASKPRRSLAPSGPVWRALVPWPLAAVAGGVAAAAAGWLVCAAFCLVAWLSDTGQPMSAPLGLAGGFFLLANGARVWVDGLVVSITPLLLTFAIMACGVGTIRLAVRHGFARSPDGGTKRVASVAGVAAGTYALIVAALASATQPAGSAVRALAGAVIVGAVTAWWAVAPALGWRLTWRPGAPAWVRAWPRACGAAIGVMCAGGAVVVIIALLVSHQRVAALQDGLQAGAFGNLLLAIGQAFWAPNLMLWGASWLTGAGVGLGTGSLVSPVAVQLGMLPSIPLFGAAPQAGAPSHALLICLAVPVAAGAVAAWVSLRAFATQLRLAGDARPGEPLMSLPGGAVIGGATGIVAGVVTTCLAAFSRGDLGQVHLVGLGPQLGSLILLAPTLLGLAGIVAGVVFAWRLPDVPANRRAPNAPAPRTPPPQPRPPDKPARSGGTRRLMEGHTA